MIVIVVVKYNAVTAFAPQPAAWDNSKLTAGFEFALPPRVHNVYSSIDQPRPWPAPSLPHAEQLQARAY